MAYTKEELQRKFFSGDYSGLNLAALVRLSFEKDYGKKKKKKPTVILSGADINGRDDQEDRVKRAVEALGGNWVYTYDEPNTSAWKRRKVKVVIDGEEQTIWRVVRPVYEGALKDLKHGIAPNGMPLDGLIVYDLDRLTRDLQNLLDAIDVVEHHGKLITDMNRTLDLFTETGRSNAKFLVTAKGMSSSDTSRRITDKHEAIAIAGIPVGGTRPFGWNADKRTLDPIEAELIRKARRDILYGDIGIRTICKEWKEDGIKTPKGNDWQRSPLRSMLLSPRLAGYRVYREDICYDHDGNPVMGQYEPILTIPEWEELRDYLTREGRGSQNVHRGGRKRLLSGVMRCGLCATLCLSYTDNRNNVYYYACPSPSQGGCGHVSINGVKLDGLITEQVLQRLAHTEAKTEVAPWPHESLLAAKEAKIKELMDAYNTDALPKEYVFPNVAQISDEVRSLKRDRSAWNRKQVRARNATASVVEQWPTLSIDRQRAVIQLFIHTIALGRRTIKATRFDPDRITIVWRDDISSDLPERLSMLLTGRSGFELPLKQLI